MPDLLFVYGSLRRGCDNDMARMLAAASDWLGPAHIRGRLHQVDWYPALIIDSAADRVEGDLFRLHDAHATLSLLDHYEECTPAFPEPWEFLRIRAEIEGLDGPVRAWIYRYNRDILLPAAPI